RRSAAASAATPTRAREPFLAAFAAPTGASYTLAIAARTAAPERPRNESPPADQDMNARKLRPSKIKNALRRREFEYRVPRLRMSRPPAGLVELGSAYGGWMMPEGVIRADWICYCVGAGGDVSFDLELIRRYGATVRSFDAVEGYVQDALKDAAGEPRFSAHHAAIALEDGPLRMQTTHHPGR